MSRETACNSNCISPNFCESTGIKTWAQNPIPNNNPFVNVTSFSGASSSAALANISLPSLWEDDVNLWLATIENIFISNNIYDSQQRFTLTLKALDFKIIRKAHATVRSPGNSPYESLKQTLTKMYGRSDNSRFEMLLNQLYLDDQKPTELLDEM